MRLPKKLASLDRPLDAARCLSRWVPACLVYGSAGYCGVEISRCQDIAMSDSSTR